MLSAFQKVNALSFKKILNFQKLTLSAFRKVNALNS